MIKSNWPLVKRCDGRKLPYGITPYKVSVRAWPSEPAALRTPVNSLLATGLRDSRSNAPWSEFPLATPSAGLTTIVAGCRAPQSRITTHKAFSGRLWLNFLQYVVGSLETITRRQALIVRSRERLSSSLFRDRSLIYSKFIPWGQAA